RRPSIRSPCGASSLREAESSCAASPPDKPASSFASAKPRTTTELLLAAFFRGGLRPAPHGARRRFAQPRISSRFGRGAFGRPPGAFFRFGLRELFLGPIEKLGRLALAFAVRAARFGAVHLEKVRGLVSHGSRLRAQLVMCTRIWHGCAARAFAPNAGVEPVTLRGGWFTEPSECSRAV